MTAHYFWVTILYEYHVLFRSVDQLMYCRIRMQVQHIICIHPDPDQHYCLDQLVPALREEVKRLITTTLVPEKQKAELVS